MAILVLVMLPAHVDSITKFSLFTIRLRRDVLVLMVSTKASCAPWTTTSLFGFETARVWNPLTSMLNAVEIVSIKRAQLPEFTSEIIFSNSVSRVIEFWGIKQLYI